MFLIDSHCHINLLNYQLLHRDFEEVLNKAVSQDVKFFLAVATTLPDYLKIRDLIGVHKRVVFSCGIHPLNQSEEYKIDDLKKLAADKNVVALGETGLDYNSKLTIETKKQQQASFCNHIQVSRELNKPVIVHTREACKDTVSILREEKVTECRGVIHCFNGDMKTVSKFLDLGLYISFSGIITFRNAGLLREVARYIPLERLLLETDSPYLAPVPYRGKENQPAYIKEIANCLSSIKRVSLNTLAEITTQNFINLFSVDPYRTLK